MSIKVRSSFLSLAIITVLIFSAIGPTIVYADGGTSTDTPPTETSTDACTSYGTSSECPTEEAAVDTTATPEPVATEIATDTSESTDASACSSSDGAVADASTSDSSGCASTDEATATVEPTADGSRPSAEATALPTTEEAAPATQEPATSTEAAPSETTTVLNDVPENTTVQVVNANGQSEPLASQAAADAIATSDPIWCPVVNGVATPPGGAGCTQSFTSFNLLLNFLSTNSANPAYQGEGTIYVQQGAYQGGESSINFNNYNLSNISSAPLTIQGGWNISDNTTNGTSTFNNIPIVIGGSGNPWGGSLTINNLALNFNPTGQSGTGLILFSQTDINLSNVSVMNSATGAGAELNAGGDVTIDHSHFDRNKTAGAIIRAKGNVAISNSSFSNPANGRRQVTGLDIVNDGSVSLFDVLADQNREIGATINSGGSVAISASVNPFTGTATTSFSGTKIIQGSAFLGYGLQVIAIGDIAITNVAANDNFLWGASLNGANVNINDSLFNANTTASPGFMDDTGLLVTSSGALGVNINHIQANDNRLIGATITSTHDVSILNSFFQNNNGVLIDSAGTQTFHGEGLHVVSGDATNNIVGNITLTSVNASNNTLVGAHLEANGDVIISDNPIYGPSIFDHNTSSNNTAGPAPTPLGRGLEIIAGGSVFLTNVTATNNEVNGVEVQGNCTTVFLTGGTYSGNGQYGLSVTNANLLQLVPAAVFANNGAGDIFQDPGTCVFPVANPPVTTPQTPPTNNGGLTPTGPAAPTQSGNVLANTLNSAIQGNSLNTYVAMRFSDGISSNIGKVTLNSFMANARFANSVHISIFMGKYAYIYSSNGMQVVAYSPVALHEVAMVGPH